MTELRKSKCNCSQLRKGYERVYIGQPLSAHGPSLFVPDVCDDLRVFEANIITPEPVNPAWIGQRILAGADRKSSWVILLIRGRYHDQPEGDRRPQLSMMINVENSILLAAADAAGAFFQQVYDKAILSGNRERAAHALNNIGVVLTKKGDLTGAKSWIERSIVLIEEIGLQQHSSAGWILDSLIEVSLKLSDLQAARHYVVKNLRFARRIGLLPLLVYTFLQAARILLTENTLDEYGLALLGFVANHPVSNLETKHELEIALANLGLDPEDPRVMSGMEKGKSLDADRTLQDLLTRFGE